MKPYQLHVAMLVAITAAPAVSQQQARFAARVDVVRVDTLVTAGGQPVRGLTAADFEVRDNGVVQQIDLVNTEAMPINAVLTLDMSGSVDGGRMDSLRGAGGKLIDALEQDDRAALVSFSHMITLGSGLTLDHGRVRQALDLAQPSGNTALIDASYAGLIVGESVPGRAMIIAFSDGVDTASWLTRDQVFDMGRRSDAVVYGVSVSGWLKPTFLRDLSGITGGTLFEIESTKDLGALFVKVLDEFRHRYLLSYTPRGVSKDGYHRLEVRVKGKDVKVRARPGYLAGG